MAGSYFSFMNIDIGYGKEVNSAPGFIFTALGLLVDCPLPYPRAAIVRFSGVPPAFRESGSGPFDFAQGPRYCVAAIAKRNNERIRMFVSSTYLCS